MFLVNKKERKSSRKHAAATIVIMIAIAICFEIIAKNIATFIFELGFMNDLFKTLQLFSLLLYDNLLPINIH